MRITRSFNRARCHADAVWPVSSRHRTRRLLGVLILSLTATLVASLVAVVSALGGAAGSPGKSSHVVTVWLKTNDGPPQIAAVGASLRSDTTVSRCVYRSQLADYREAETLLSPREFAALTVSSTPASFRCHLSRPSQRTEFVQRVRSLAGVLQVTLPYDSVTS
jgi:cell division protein FtsX